MTTEIEKDSTEALIAQLDAPKDMGSKQSAEHHVVAKRLLSKNARKSRKALGKNKGDAKKGGGGSKTVWGKVIFSNSIAV